MKGLPGVIVMLPFVPFLSDGLASLFSARYLQVAHPGVHARTFTGSPGSCGLASMVATSSRFSGHFHSLVWIVNCFSHILLFILGATCSHFTV